MFKKELFAEPPKEFRPSPFWSWNDKLTDEELILQIRDMKEKGFGGYFMHSRVGLITDYLSDEWIERVRTCVEEGKKLDMESWMYDEDKWPSGFAGGLVPELGDEYRVKTLKGTKLTQDTLDELLNDKANPILSIIGFSQEGKTISNLTLISENEIADKLKTESFDHIYGFQLYTAKTGNNWFNGLSYVDLLNPKVTEEFLDITYTPYEKAFAEDFGEHLPGVFTDEPNIYPIGEDLGQLPWTPDFPEYFKELYGYDILDKLPLLFFEGDGYTKVRYDYWKAITKRFVDSFTKLCFERCDKNNLKLTGHVLLEDSLGVQIPYAGAAMPHYEYQHVPGIDHLGRNIDNPLTLKQVSSVANQFSRPRVLCEIFGVSGHSMTFEDQKWIADFHFALGITFINQHLTLYSMVGERKRDYPPTFSYHQPYWDYYRYINDYFSRCSYFLQQGRFAADILVLHTIGSAWAVYEPEWEGRHFHGGGDRVRELDKGLDTTLRSLLASHYSYDFGDELIMERHGEVVGDKMRVKDATYKVVVIPPSLNLASSTFNLLKTFAQNGGKIVTTEKKPTMIDGEDSSELVEFLDAHALHAASPGVDDLEAALSKVYAKGITILDENGKPTTDIYCHHRIDGDKHLYFISTYNRDEHRHIKIFLDPVGEVLQLDPATGDVETINNCIADGKTLICTSLPPVGSLLYIIDTTKQPVILDNNEMVCCDRVNCRKKAQQTLTLPSEWEYENTHLNSMPLDYCRYAFGDDPLSEKVPVFKVRNAAFEHFNLKRWEGIQPWYILRNKPELEGDTRVQVEFEFESDITSGAWLVVEKAHEWEITVNGKKLDTNTKEWYWDHQFTKLNLDGILTTGTNTVSLTREFDVLTEIEEVYVVGDFGVEYQENRGYVLVNKRQTLQIGSWVEQGFPFYAGNMVYKTTVDIKKQENKKYLLTLGKANGSLYEIRVNGKHVANVAWQPWEADITDYITDGNTLLELVVVSTLRNTMGPLHHRRGDLRAVGPDTFKDEVNWVDEYQLVPYGLFEEPKLVIY